MPKEKWTKEEDALLTKLWNAKNDTGRLSAIEIGVAMGKKFRRLAYTKGAIIGRRKRLDLPDRKSPILFQGTLSSVDQTTKPKHGTKTTAHSVVQSVTRLVAPVVPVASSPPAEITRRARIIPCCFPMWNSKTDSNYLQFCDVGSAPNRQYCVEHMKIAFMKITFTENAA